MPVCPEHDTPEVIKRTTACPECEYNALACENRLLVEENERLKEQLDASCKRGIEISDVPCCRCHGPVIEFSIPNELWNIIVRNRGPETNKEYLCLDCFACVAAEKIDDARHGTKLAESEIAGRDQEIERLKANWEGARNLADAYFATIDEAIRLFERITSADGSGHADLGRTLATMRHKAADSFGEFG